METWTDRLAGRIAGGEALVAGVLSGTSADGIDVALARFPDADAEGVGVPELLAFATTPFEPELARRVRALLDAGAGPDGPPVALGELARLDRDLGRAFGRAAARLAQDRGVPLGLVASHGQTVWHHDGGVGGPASLQLGCGDELAEAAGCAVACDFRRRDVAAGGEGAPLSPLADGALFAALARPGAVLNLGGLANLTLLTEGGLAAAFDTGPAGSLLDGLARRLLGRPFDEGGRRALAGYAHPVFVESLAAHPFLARRPPKSTGRDTFGGAYVTEVLALARGLAVERDEDVLASACDFVALHVARGMALVPGFPADAPVAVAGGGLENAALRAALERRLPGPVASSADCGVDPAAREALVFAVLGARCLFAIPSTEPAATGARPGRVLGRLCLPGREARPSEPRGMQGTR